jgi:beta-glucanase (GH16 family)
MEFYRTKKGTTILANVAWGSNEKLNGEWDSDKKGLNYFLKKDPDWVNKFHVWALKWNADNIQIFIDNELINEIDLEKTINPNGENPFTSDQKFYIILNLALGSNGGDPSTSDFPIKFEVDYVRVYQ